MTTTTKATFKVLLDKPLPKDMRPSPLSLLLVSGGSLVLSAPSSRRDDAPIVTLTAGPKGTVRGSSSPLVDLFPLPFDYGGIETFKGIPYAQPPVGPLRLKPPVPLDPATDVGEIDATTSFPAACPQQLNSKDAFFVCVRSGDLCMY